ncbi:MAG TPA: exosome complex RNA-binding protein Rrp4 [Candidatus Bathyarchaeia archaeon]|nr:exosome complex RNA-binding protein Rrp4 [Candidatus Bathyarchaeia archaeon]
MHAELKQLVTPGDLLAEGPYFAGENTYRDGSKIYSSRIGLADIIGNKLIVVPIKGAYIPRIDDIVIGRITDIGMSGWQVDISAPYPAMLPASETPMDRDAGRGDLALHYGVGDLTLAQVIAFDRTRDPLLTTKGRGLGKVTSGKVARIAPAKIPRVIGKKGSMITMLKKETNTDIVPGQNGVILAIGKNPDQERIAIDALYMIEREAHTNGLTDRVRAMIQEEMKGKVVG